MKPMETMSNIKSVVREAVIRALTEENIKNRQAEFVISTEAVDTYDTVFKLDGWDLERYVKNPIVAYGHRTWDAEPDNIIGTSQVRIEGNMLLGLVTFEDAETNPKAEKIWKKVQAGTLRMASISADVKEWRFGDAQKGENPGVIYFTRSELFEWSIVPIGSNPDALKRSAQTVEEIRAELAKQQTEDNGNTTREDKGLSVFDAQCLINKNLL